MICENGNIIGKENKKENEYEYQNGKIKKNNGGTL
jgi:hypothetical protein